MLILALDTAMSACSVALLEQGIDRADTASPLENTLAKRSELMGGRGQSEALMPMICAVMDEASRPLSDVGLIAVTRGPGAFTGLRIGLSVARGLALALKIPCLGITTTQAVAEGVNDLKTTDLLVVALDTKRADFYIQVFTQGNSSTQSPTAVGPPCALPPDLLSTFVREQVGVSENIIVVGDAAKQVCEIFNNEDLIAHLSTASPIPDPVKIATLATKKWASNQDQMKNVKNSHKNTEVFNLADQPAPLYLRPPDAVIPKNGGRLRP